MKKNWQVVSYNCEVYYAYAATPSYCRAIILVTLFDRTPCRLHFVTLHPSLYILRILPLYHHLYIIIIVACKECNMFSLFKKTIIIGSRSHYFFKKHVDRENM